MPGDKIVIAPTGKDGNETEVRRIMHVVIACEGRFVTLLYWYRRMKYLQFQLMEEQSI